jgi:hypothetical protein
MLTLPALLKHWSQFEVSLMQRFLLSAAAVAGALLCAAPALAGGGTFIVPSTTDIWLSGQPAGSSVTGFFGTDTAPANSPVQIAGALTGGSFTFAATGMTGVSLGCTIGPDGGCFANENLGFETAPVNGIGDYTGPSEALIGVFLGAANPTTNPGPSSDDFTDPAVISQTSFAPLLNQIFFIGDGLTGTGSGSTQTFFAPDGATRLFLAVADSEGGSTGNFGQLDVTFTSSADVTVTPAVSVPEPAAWALLIAGFGLAGTALRRRRAIATT